MNEHIMGQADKISEKRDPGAIWDLSAAQKAASIRELAYKEGYAAGVEAMRDEGKYKQLENMSGDLEWARLDDVNRRLDKAAARLLERKP